MLKKFPAFFSLLLILLFIICSNTEVKSQNSPYINEKRVMNLMRRIYNAQIQYQATVGNGNFGSFDQLRQANLIDERLLIPYKRYGYELSLIITTRSTVQPPRFDAYAVPYPYRRTGFRSFYIDSQCTLRGADKGGNFANANDPAIETCTPAVVGENERAVIQALRTLVSAQYTYQATVGNGNFGTLDQLREVGLISSELATGIYNYYFLSVQATPATVKTPAFFKISTKPMFYREVGIRSFYVDVEGVIRGADKNGEFPDGTEPPIED